MKIFIHKYYFEHDLNNIEILSYEPPFMEVKANIIFKKNDFLFGFKDDYMGFILQAEYDSFKNMPKASLGGQMLKVVPCAKTYKLELKNKIT